MKLDTDEREILSSFDKGKRKSLKEVTSERKRLSRVAAATFRKDRRVNIRISGKDRDALVKALEEGIPYQTLISSVLHKYVSGRLRAV